MLLCRPFWLPREFTAIIITAVYIPLQANTDQALKELYGNISEQETAHTDAAFIITGDFNKANFRTIAPKYFQLITINTRGDRDAYKSLPCPPFGKSDHSSILLLPAYRQKLKREAPALRTIQCWSDQSDAILQRCNRLYICNVVAVHCMVPSDSRCASAVCACSPVEKQS